MEVKIEPKEWETLLQTADEILKTATRDYVLWSQVKKQILLNIEECQTETTSEEEEKSTKSETNLREKGML